MKSACSLLRDVACDEPLLPELGFRFNDAERMKFELGDALMYAQPIEAEVPISASVAHAVAPNMDATLAEFLKVWEPQEVAHGAIEANTLQAIGLTPGLPVSKLTTGLRVAGRLASVSPGFHDIAEQVVVVYAGLGEREVTIAYPRMAKIARKIGESAYASDVLMPMAAQEGKHLNFYIAQAREKGALLRPWQRRAVRRIIELGYRPVGVQRANTERMKGFGKMLLTIEPDDPLQIAERVEAVLANIMQDVKSAEGFLAKRYQQCLDQLL